LCYAVLFGIKGAITKPSPNPIKIQAINRSAEVLRKMNPMPRPIIVDPAIAHELLSVLLVFIICGFYKMVNKLG